MRQEIIENYIIDISKLKLSQLLYDRSLGYCKVIAIAKNNKEFRVKFISTKEIKDYGLDHIKENRSIILLKDPFNELDMYYTLKYLIAYTEKALFK